MVAHEPGRTFIETARRAQIAAVAIDTFAGLGCAGASFARIAERLGISRGLISYHFAGKDDLMRQVVHEAAVRNAVSALEHVLSGSQVAGQFRPDFDPHVMAIAIRAAIEAASPLLASGSRLDIDSHSRELVAIFDLAARPRGTL